MSIFYVHVIKAHLFELNEEQTAQTTGVYRSSIVLFTNRTINKISLYYLRFFIFTIGAQIRIFNQYRLTKHELKLRSNNQSLDKRRSILISYIIVTVYRD